jgi:aromatic ring hydroxylase
MGLRTVAQFLSGLRDGREVYYRGQRVSDVTEHPELGVAARHAAIDFQLAENPKFQQLATRREGDAVYST